MTVPGATKRHVLRLCAYLTIAATGAFALTHAFAVVALQATDAAVISVVIDADAWHDEAIAIGTAEIQAD